METDELLLTLGWVSNRGSGQTKMLFELCDKDLNKLLKLEAYMKRKFLYACPSDKKTVDEYLQAWETLRLEDKHRNGS